jgi:predicted RNA-binding protein with PIN domain
VTDEILIVDGYNIIFAWDELKDIALTDSLENARTRLLEELSNYSGLMNNRVVVIFDAYKVNSSIRNYSNYHNIEVVFTKKAETADHYIEKIAHLAGRTYNIKVATSDGIEQLIVLSRGATRISARELYVETQNANATARKEYIKKPKTSRNRLEGHLDDDVIEWMEKMRRM